jgi:hypothetical protein
VVEAFDGTHESKIPLLDQIEDSEAGTFVTAGHTDHQAQIALDELSPCIVAGVDSTHEKSPLSALGGRVVVEALLGETPCDHQLGQALFVGRSQERIRADVIEILTKQLVLCIS